MDSLKKLRSTWVGLGWGFLVGWTPFLEPISSKARITLGLGLLFTYFSVGLLLDWIPFPSRVRGRISQLSWGALFGAFYSLPGAVFTMTPYPLADDAPAYFREFANGGWRAFFLTLAFGAVVGATCLVSRKKANR